MHAACTSLVAMAARATRSSSRKARLTEAVATGPLGALSHDELGVIVDGLADPLQPVVAVALSSTCLGLRTPLLAALEVLKQRHEKAKALCRKAGTCCAWLHEASHVDWNHKGLTVDHMASLGMILRTNGLPRMQELNLGNNFFGDEGMQSIFTALGRGMAPLLCRLDFYNNQFGPAGAEALAASLRRGAMPKLSCLNLLMNPIGSQGLTALAPELGKLPALKHLILTDCEVGDEGVASLYTSLGKDDFKELVTVHLEENLLKDNSCAGLVSALDAGAFPNLQDAYVNHNLASLAAQQAVVQAVARSAARHGTAAARRTDG